jgi:hypothetical protein
MEEDLLVEAGFDESDLVELATEVGVVTFAHVGDNRYVAWSCKGEVAWIRARRADGNFRDIPVTSGIRSDLSLETLLKTEPLHAQ